MPLKPCLTCGTPTTATRCPGCERRRRIHRYGGSYQAERRTWEPVVATGTVPCARCGQRIVGAFDLDHVAGGLAPSHPRCNRSAH